jgi:hypothetical protein
VQYYCNKCHTPFEYVKDDDVFDHRGAANVLPSSSSEM